MRSLVLLTCCVTWIVPGVTRSGEPLDPTDERETLLARARQSVAEAADRLGADPTRPAVHFRPPAQWMNDPNGTIFFDGYYHLFYQHNPYGDRWGNMHWGHARSKDLVRWEHLPIALWPSKGAGEEHVFSGCAAVNGEGTLMLFYTSVGPGRPNEQWAALPMDEAGIAWKKHPDNPLITTRQPDGTTFEGGMRDPFIFREEGRTLMVVGADTETEAVLPLFEASDPTLSDWEYKGIIWRVSKDVMAFPECPNFFPLGDRYVLLTSPYRPVEYRVGSFDLDRKSFQPETVGRIDQSDQFYASNIATAPDGRCILFGWARGFPEGQGWNGCLALPRELSLGPDHRPRQRPVSELSALRARRQRFEGEVRDSARPIEGITSHQVEIRAVFDPDSADRSGFRFRNADGGEIASIVFEGESASVAGVDVPLDPRDDGRLMTVRAFLDRTLLEVFLDDGRQCVTRVVPFGGEATVEVFAEGGSIGISSLDAWELEPIWPEASE